MADREEYAVCSFRKDEFVTVYPADVVLFEGILMFYSQEIRDMFQMKLFVDTDPDTRLSRRGVLHEHDHNCCTLHSFLHKLSSYAYFRAAAVLRPLVVPIFVQMFFLLLLSCVVFLNRLLYLDYCLMWLCDFSSERHQ